MLVKNVISNLYQVGKYYLDGYDKTNNKGYEVDEMAHRRQKEYDMKRDNFIKEVLGCTIERIDERSFLKQYYAEVA